MEQEQRLPSRLGLLSIDCRLPDRQPTAGREFSVAASVQNPFDMPIVIRAVRLMVPVGLRFVSKDRGIDRRPTESEGDLIGADATDDGCSVELLDGQVQVAPGDTLVHLFTIRTSYWFFATTEEHEVQLVVSYMVENTQRRQAKKVSFTTRTGILPPILGSIAGSFLGSMAKTYVAHQGELTASWDFGWQLGVSVVFAVVATLVTIRRLGTQPVVTVEDVYGGFVFGFLVGYLGRDFFESLIPAGQKTVHALQVLSTYSLC